MIINAENDLRGKNKPTISGWQLLFTQTLQ